ncbi:MAG: LysR family transcriptional regulator [Burkholderiales bacterium]|nr:MAG: LysR family transcriptional regulator [Burkholderiales bacterium]
MPFSRRVTLRHLRCLEALARQGSYSGAARELSVTQPAVSMQMRELESVVGMPIVDSHRRGVHLTQPGEILLRRAREAMNALHLAEAELGALAGLTTGVLEIAVISTAEYFMPHLLAEFGRRHPDLSIRLHVENRARLIERLASEELDLAIMGTVPAQLPVRTIAFAPHHLSFVAPPAHPLATARSIDPRELEQHRILLREKGSGTRANLERYLRTYGVRIGAADELGSNETIKQAAMAGMGIAFLSHHAFAMEHQAGRLVRLAVAGTPLEREWQIVRRREREPSPASQALIDFLMSEAPQRLARMTAFEAGEPAAAAPAGNRRAARPTRAPSAGAHRLAPRGA